MSSSSLTGATLLFTFIISATGFSNNFGNNYFWQNVADEPLPRSVVPESYYLHVNPNISDGYFTGDVRINVMCQEPTNTIVLHASEDLNITDEDVTINYEGNEITTGLSVIGISRNASAETVTITVEEELVNGALYELYLPFSGEMENMDYGQPGIIKRKPVNSGYMHYGDMLQRRGGFFSNSYQNPYTGKTSWNIGTKMFPRSARRVFPCFDEPSFKATFEIVVGHMSNMSALSVMPVAYTKEDEKHEGWVLDHFVPTPPISTFSVGVLISDLETEEPVKVASSQGGFILQFHHQRLDPAMKSFMNSTKLVPGILEYLQDYFGVAYPVPVLNIVFLSRFIYDTDADSLGLFLLPEYLMQVPNPNYISGLVNQWTYHMATPRRWSDYNVTSILNNFLASECLLKFNYGQQMYVQEAYDHYDMASYRINYAQNNQWSPVSTFRGEWFFQMLNSSLTENTFKSTLRKFLSNNKFGTFTEDMLWDSLTQQAWADGTLPEPLSVDTIKNSWLLQNNSNFPVLTVTRNYDENIASLEQQMFIQEYPQNLTEKEQKTFWWIPIMYLTPDNLDPSSLRTVAWMRDQRYFNIGNLPDSQSFMIVNPIDTGLFLVNYDQQNWRLITQYLVSSAPNVPTATRKKLLNDAFLLAANGQLNYSTALNMTLFLFNETDYSVWMPFLKRIPLLQEHCLWTSVEGKFNLYLKHMLQPKIGLEDIQVDYMRDPAHAIFTFSARDIFSRAGYTQQSNRYPMMHHQASSFIIYDNNTELSIQCPEFMKNASENWITYADQIWSFAPTYMRSNHLDKCPGFVELIERVLNATVDEEKIFSYHSWHSVMHFITSNPTAHNMTFNFFFKHFENIKQRFFFMEDIWTPLLSGITSKIKSQEGLNKLVEFYEEHKSKFGYSQKTIEESIKKVTNEVLWGKENLPDIEFWIDHVLPNFNHSSG